MWLRAGTQRKDSHPRRYVPTSKSSQLASGRNTWRDLLVWDAGEAVHNALTPGSCTLAVGVYPLSRARFSGADVTQASPLPLPPAPSQQPSSPTLRSCVALLGPGMMHPSWGAFRNRSKRPRAAEQLRVELFPSRLSVSPRWFHWDLCRSKVDGCEPRAQHLEFEIFGQPE